MNPNRERLRRIYDPADTELASGFSVRDYERARDSSPPDRAVVADAIQRRFTERYIAPARAKPRHGFMMMAVSCLMIETLESFRQGWDNSDRRGKEAFCAFFDHWDTFKDFRGHAEAFYIGVRCGILHQAETTRGWRIRRGRSVLFDPLNRVVNAERFLSCLNEVLNSFCGDLKTAPWSGYEWRMVQKKMNAIAHNCRGVAV